MAWVVLLLPPVMLARSCLRQLMQEIIASCCASKGAGMSPEQFAKLREEMLGLVGTLLLVVFGSMLERQGGVGSASGGGDKDEQHGGEDGASGSGGRDEDAADDFRTPEQPCRSDSSPHIEGNTSRRL